jgi:hypothetical protein
MSAPTFRSASLATLFFSLATFTLLAPASAARIVSATNFAGQFGTGPGVGLVAVPSITTNLVNNDNEPGPGANNIDVVVKRFDANGHIDIEFNLTPSGGVTEYLVFEAVDNNTGAPWLAYTMQLGTGVNAGFTPSGALDGLDFDFPTFDSFPASTAFPVVLPTEDMLTFVGGVHGAGLQTYQVRIDVPDGISRFTLRQIPNVVPEPATLMLGAVAALGLFAIRRRS